MVRTTKTGGIKMIYNGEVVDPVREENGNVIGGKCTNTGTATQLSGTIEFNAKFNDNAYVGYMYGIASATASTTNVCVKLNSAGTAAEVGTETDEASCIDAGGKWAETPYEATHANVVDSTIKNKIDTWFASSNLNMPENLEKIEDAVYCNDRTIYTNYGTALGYGAEQTAYIVYNRLYTSSTRTPILECLNENDRFTVKSENGNGDLTYPVGLLTADEIVLAGGRYSSGNNDYYLYTGQYYWTLSPYNFYSNNAVAFNVSSDGYLNGYYIISNNNFGTRPVISLVSSTNFASGGTGTKDNPYVVE